MAPVTETKPMNLGSTEDFKRVTKKDSKKNNVEPVSTSVCTKLSVVPTSWLSGFPNSWIVAILNRLDSKNPYIHQSPRLTGALGRSQGRLGPLLDDHVHHWLNKGSWAIRKPQFCWDDLDDLGLSENVGLIFPMK